MTKRKEELPVSRLPETTVGERLYRLRKIKELTQEELSSLLGCNTGYYGQIERGNVALSLSMAGKVKGIYNTTYDYILDGVKDSPDYAGDKQQYHDLMHLLIQQCTEEECRFLYSVCPSLLSGLYELRSSQKKEEEE